MHGQNMTVKSLVAQAEAWELGEHIASRWLFTCCTDQIDEGQDRGNTTFQAN